MEKYSIGLTAWQRSSNHNRMIELQRDGLVKNSDNQSNASDHRQTNPNSSSTSVELAYFGSSAFRVTSPSGLTVMIDPWRNHPSRKWDWYFADFPETVVDIGVATHAHFDHDALHCLDAHVLLDRLIGNYQFGDISITGIADKHAIDSQAALYDFKNIILEFDGIDISPPNNPRSWDNCLITVKTGGLSILHWGDNRDNPAEEIWDSLGQVDVLLLPADDSQHVLSFDAIEKIIERIKPRWVVPHHYYIWDLVQRQSTLLPLTSWLQTHSNRLLTLSDHRYQFDSVLAPVDSDQRKDDWQILFFGDHVGFDKTLWRTGA